MIRPSRAGIDGETSSTAGTDQDGGIISARVLSSLRPSQKMSSALSNRLSPRPAAREKSVMDERNFMSSGEPKMSCALLSVCPSTSLTHWRSRCPRRGWAR